MFKLVFSFVLLSLLPLDPAVSQSIARDGTYRAANGQFSLAVPRASNWAGVAYRVTALDNRGDRQYDRVMLHVDDFGEYAVIGVRTLPAETVAAMDQDDSRDVLRNISRAALASWRMDLAIVPDPIEESFVMTRYGEQAVHVYRVENGSLMSVSRGAGPASRFDTFIVSLVVRQGPMVAFVLAQNDSNPDEPTSAKTKATGIFDALTIPAVGTQRGRR